MARSIGNPAANQESSWSAEMCGLRLPPNEVYPQYLPWPRVPTPGELKSLEASYLPKEGLPAVLLGENTLINAGSAVGLLSNCLGTESNGSDSACIATPEIVSDEAGFCSKIQASVGARLGFVAYRQSRQHAADPNPSEFHQVSPLIDQVHCWEELTEQYLTGSAARGHLDDPFVELVRFSATSSFHAGENGLVFVDRSPHEVGLQFRYQLVYFANDHEIVGYRTTDWLISKESN